MEFYTNFIQECFDADGKLQSYTLQYEDNFNYGYDVIDVLGEQYPDRTAMIWHNDQNQRKVFTFAQISRMSTQAALVLQSYGLKKGDVLMACMRSHWEYWVIAVAAHKLGLILSPVYYRLTENDLAYRMERASVSAVICCRDGDTPVRVLAAANRAGVPNRFTIGGHEDGFLDFSSLLEEQQGSLERCPTLYSEPILIYFTSGTTGEPKAVLHDHIYPLANHCGSRYMQDVHDGSIHFATGDTGWEVVSGTKFYGQWLSLGTLLVYDYDRFPVEQVLECLVKEKATSVMAQPTVYRMMTDVGMDRYDLSSVTCFAIGGEKLLPDLAQTICSQIRQPLYEGYAQSEAGLIAANTKNMGRRDHSSGKILPKYHVELLKDDQTFADPGEEGEIVIVADGGKRPAGLMIGYLNDEEANRTLWDGNLFHTGDLAVVDEDGYLYYRGRADGMIKTKGYRVSPVEIEGLLSSHPAVYECIVVGEQDRELGQRIVAYVKPTEGYAASEKLAQELMEYHNHQCAGYKKVREVRFVEALARNTNGKLIRNQFSK